jgi:hypothetical protein
MTAKLIQYDKTEISAYSGEADHDSGTMPIGIPGPWRSPSERSDAGLFHDPRLIGISQSFCSFLVLRGEWGVGRGGGV